MEKVILFQGDSITDCRRIRELSDNLGLGYPNLVSAELGYENPGQYQFLNRGISGNRIVDLYARIKMDIINLKPDYLSILIGVNDVWHEIPGKNGVATEKYEKIYDMLITELKEALPELKILIMEPFVLPGSATVDCPEIPDRWQRFSQDVYDHAAAARRVAEKHGLPFLELQAALDEADAKAPGYWLADGVHPTPFGHELLKRRWLELFRTL